MAGVEKVPDTHPTIVKIEEFNAREMKKIENKMNLVGKSVNVGQDVIAQVFRTYCSMVQCEYNDFTYGMVFIQCYIAREIIQATITENKNYLSTHNTWRS